MKEDKRKNNGGARTGAGRPKKAETVVITKRVLKEWASPVRKAIDETILKLKNKAK